MRFQFRLLLMSVLILVGSCLPLHAKDPTRAMLYSALIPGGGQIYNQQYAKAGVVIGLQAYLAGLAIYHDNKADDYRKLAANTTDAYLHQLNKTRAQEYTDKRTSDIWWIGVTAVLSILDAYVDAHLSDFESEKNKLHLRFEGDKVALGLKF